MPAPTPTPMVGTVERNRAPDGGSWDALRNYSHQMMKKVPAVFGVYKMRAFICIYSILAWRIPWTKRSPGATVYGVAGLDTMEPQHTVVFPLSIAPLLETWVFFLQILQIVSTSHSSYPRLWSAPWEWPGYDLLTC